MPLQLLARDIQPDIKPALTILRQRPIRRVDLHGPQLREPIPEGARLPAADPVDRVRELHIQKEAQVADLGRVGAGDEPAEGLDAEELERVVAVQNGGAAVAQLGAGAQHGGLEALERGDGVREDGAEGVFGVSAVRDVDGMLVAEEVLHHLLRQFRGQVEDGGRHHGGGLGGLKGFLVRGSWRVRRFLDQDHKRRGLEGLCTALEQRSR